ncbi:disease resistance protein RGA5-like [Phragmites australis]|uniref:disease resistance protein RGA5-like n=1 Tax=Phragmites australis TaxID=29695 RepID=UPI002D799068|nr:disease resistance protein RGA5-like [Phragmites australis]
MEAQGAMGSLLTKLADLLADECGRLKGVRREIRFLRSEMNNMQALLQKCTAMEHPDIQVKAWTKEVRELAYDIEDCVDKYVHKVGTGEHHGLGGIKGFLRQCAWRLKTLRAKHHIANQIQELKARVIEVRERRERYKLDDVASSSSSSLPRDPRLCALFVEEDHLVGIDGPRDDLVSWLVEGDTGSIRRRKVLSIFGFGGLGKTTLANEIRRKIEKQFDCQVLVPVSQKPDFKKILCDILRGINKKDDVIKETETWDERRLIEKIREILQHKRYLITIDDVWSIAAWDQLKCALPENDNGSRVITTTRIESVANACCSLPGDRCYKVEPLSDFHSTSLFIKRIFGSEDGCPVQLEHASAEILQKCGGLPLAIVSIASLLASKLIKAKDQWEKVSLSIGSALGKDPDLEGMKTILSLSYNDLPHHLKTCLLYLCIFPEDEYIERDSLVRRWIAEGFINEERGQTVEDVAESYFNELINRSMILPVDIGYGVKACRLHDMMLEFITSKAIEENFVMIVGPNTMSSKPEGVVRRLSIQYHGQLAPQEMSSLSHVRSLSVFGNRHKHTLPFADLRVLRVLNLDCELYDVDDLKMICKLQQLKYLRLNASELPAQIGELQCLETLEWTKYSLGKVLPQGVTRLQHLKHLLVEQDGKLPEGVGSMQALQTLSRFNICDSSITAVLELGKLKNLRELSVSWNLAEPSDARYKEYFLYSLAKLGRHSLRSLNIESEAVIPVDFLASLSPPYLLQKFWMWNSYFQRCPKWIAPLNNLAELKLDVWELENEDLHVLGELPALQNLQLWVVPLRKERIVVKGTGFRSLLAFRFWSGLPCLTFEERSMPKLETLELFFSACGAKSYGRTHSGIEHLQSLKHVQVEIFMDGATKSNIVAAERKIKIAVAKHLNNLKTNIVTGIYGYYGEVMNDGEVLPALESEGGDC